jgi:hypothetical protein
MNILEEIQSDTICDNLVIDKTNGNRYCKYLTNSIGRLHPTTKSFCNLTCRQKGPYNNKVLSSDDNKKFIISTLKKYNPFFIINKDFISRVLKIYKMPVDIVIPDEFSDVGKELEFLKDYKGFKQFLLTGSSITGKAKRPLHDLDIVLWFDNLSDYLNQNISNILPKYINGIKTDFFIIIGDKDISLSSLFFCCLSPDDKKLYKSKWFDLQISSIPEDFEIVDSECEYFDEIMHDMFLNSEKITPTKSCCGR